MPLNRKVLVDLIAMLSIVLVGVVGYKLSPLLLPKVDVRVLPDPACNLNRESCRVSLPAGASIEFSLAPRPIPLVSPLQVTFRATGIAPRRAWADFAGVGMGMGFNRPEFKPRADGSWVAETSLPVCITGQMTWDVTLLLETATQRIAIPFRFQSAFK